MRAVIAGMGWVTAGGAGLLGRGDPFTLTGSGLSTRDQGLLLPRPLPHFGRLDAYSRLGLAATSLALRDAGQEAGAVAGTGMVCGTHFGCLQTDLAFAATLEAAGGGHPSPALFAYTLPSAFVGEAGILFGLTGPGFVTASGSDLDPLETAMECLCLREAPQMLAGWCDAGCGGCSVPPSTAARWTPGAIICLLTPAGAGHVLLEWRPAGGLHCMGHRLQDLADLVRRCARLRSGGA